MQLRALSLIFLCAHFAFGQCPPPAISVKLVAHGDSITYGAGTGVTAPFVAVLATLVTAPGVTASTLISGTPGISWNYAWSGWLSNPNTMIQEAPALIDTVLVESGYKTKWLIAFAGTNGLVNALGQHTPVTEYANFEQYITARRAAGWDMNHTVVGTMLPRGAATEDYRVAYNALLIAGAVAYKYRLARFDLDLTIGQANQNLNTAYYVDGVHPTNAGHVILAGILHAAMYGDTGNPQPVCGSAGLSGQTSLTGTVK